MCCCVANPNFWQVADERANHKTGQVALCPTVSTASSSSCAAAATTGSGQSHATALKEAAIVPRVVSPADIIRDVTAYLLNRASTTNNMCFTVRTLTQEPDLYYKRESIMNVLSHLLGHGIICLCGTYGEQMFKFVLPQDHLSPKQPSPTAASADQQQRTSTHPSPVVLQSSLLSTSFQQQTLRQLEPVSDPNKQTTGCTLCTETHATHVVSLGPGARGDLCSWLGVFTKAENKLCHVVIRVHKSLNNWVRKHCAISFVLHDNRRCIGA